MWVRIREVSFPVERTDAVIDHVRDTAVARSDGEGFRGYRLLVDRPNGAALEVSYWASEHDARADGTSGQAAPEAENPVGVPGGAVVRTNYYELGIDAG